MRISSVIDENGLEEFLKKDTKDYTNTKTSVSCRIYRLETEKLPADKNLIESLSNEKLLVEKECSRVLNEIDHMEKSSVNPLSYVSFLSKKKKLTKEAIEKRDKSLEILEHKIKVAKENFENDRILCQQLKSKLEADGISWEELKRLIQEKIAQGFLVFETEKHKITYIKPIKKDNLDVFKKETEKIAKKPTRTKPGEGGRTFKEKHFTTKQELLKLKGLTAKEKRELEEILGIMFYDDDEKDTELSMRLRLAMLEDQKRRFHTIAMNTSNKVLNRNVLRYFMQDGGRVYQNDFRNFIMSDKLKRDFFREKAVSMLFDSGFDRNSINNLLPKYVMELDYLFSNPREMGYILDRLEGYQNTEYFSTEFEKHLRNEVGERVLRREQMGLSSPKGQVFPQKNNNSGVAVPQQNINNNQSFVKANSNVKRPPTMTMGK